MHVELCRRCVRWAYSQSEKNRAAKARYRQSDKGRATETRYAQLDKCRAMRRRYMQSENGRAAKARYDQSAKGRAMAAVKKQRHRQWDHVRAREARYAQTDKMRAIRRRYRQSEVGRVAGVKARALRRARQRNATVLEPVDRRTIFALDAGLCHLCDLPVDGQAFHIDHVIPIAVVAIHAEFNCAVAHATCNIRKPRRQGNFMLSATARARWQERRPAHLALLDEHFARLAA